ncbi:hypothetical protein L596_028431 [Steinernema carpocapsae]|uniref:Uncharacterized protein n=1 Tax=Steinernema carpocapsae TaxID=34508 RepID=A0A4U5LYH5_STECR|nr:hypothetical protein L596_028431 [Steinernema carpocapsae]
MQGRLHKTLTRSFSRSFKAFRVFSFEKVLFWLGTAAEDYGRWTQRRHDRSRHQFRRKRFHFEENAADEPVGMIRVPTDPQTSSC